MRWRFATGLLLACLAGCSRDDTGDRQVVQLWAMGQEGEVVARMLPRFEASHPQIDVRLQQLPWTAAHEKLLTAFAGDALPDVVPIGNTWIAEFAALAKANSQDEGSAAQGGDLDFFGRPDRRKQPHCGKH